MLYKRQGRASVPSPTDSSRHLVEGRTAICSCDNRERGQTSSCQSTRLRCASNGHSGIDPASRPSPGRPPETRPSSAGLSQQHSWAWAGVLPRDLRRPSLWRTFLSGQSYWRCVQISPGKQPPTTENRATSAVNLSGSQRGTKTMTS